MTRPALVKHVRTRFSEPGDSNPGFAAQIVDVGLDEQSGCTPLDKRRRHVNSVNMTDVRKRICDATRTVFKNEGAGGISMRRIAADVGITPTAIYRHFTDKSALIAAIVDEGFSILEHKMLRAAKGPTGRDTLMRLLDGYVDFALAYPQYYDFMFLLPRTDVRRYPEDFRRRESDSFNILSDLVSETIESGEFRQDDALETSLTIWSHVHGFVSLYRCGRFGDHPVRFRRSFRRSLHRLFDGLAS